MSSVVTASCCHVKLCCGNAQSSDVHAWSCFAQYRAGIV